MAIDEEDEMVFDELNHNFQSLKKRIQDIRSYL